MAKVALTGKLRSGKDSAAFEFLKHGYHGYKLSMGITEIIQTYFSDELNSDKKLRNHYTTIGQSLRQLDDLVWVKRTWNEIERDHLLTNCENVIITDLRQKNEEEFLRNKGFVIVKVECADQLRIERSLSIDKDFDLNQLVHETELSVDEITADYVIKNEGTLKDLKNEVLNLIDSL